MLLIPLVERDEIAKAFGQYAARLDRGGIPLRRFIWWQDGGGRYTVRWHPQLRIWTLLDPNPDDDRYWCCYGIQDPAKEESLAITCEINFPRAGTTPSTAGALLRDENGRIWLGHSGRIGGGQPGVGKESFLAFYREARRASVTWADGKRTPLILIGALDDAELPTQVAQFVHDVAECKAPR